MDNALKETNDIDGLRQCLLKVKEGFEKLCCEVDSGTCLENKTGLALSGGGIRSATFNLGLLQALEKKKLLEKIDYMSTVSGGGYIGSALTYMKAKNGTAGTSFLKRKPHNPELAWIRQHASYLVPGNGLDGWAMAAAILRGVTINLLFLLPPFFIFMWIYTRKFGEGSVLKLNLLKDFIIDRQDLMHIIVLIGAMLVSVAYRKLMGRFKDQSLLEVFLPQGWNWLVLAAGIVVASIIIFIPPWMPEMWGVQTPLWSALLNGSGTNHGSD